MVFVKGHKNNQPTKEKVEKVVKVKVEKVAKDTQAAIKAAEQHILDNLEDSQLKDLLTKEPELIKQQNGLMKPEDIEDERPSEFNQVLESFVRSENVNNPVFSDKNKTKDQLDMMNEYTGQTHEMIKSATVTNEEASIKHYPAEPSRTPESVTANLQNIIYEIMSYSSKSYIEARALAEEYAKQGLNSMQVKANLLAEVQADKIKKDIQQTTSGITTTQIKTNIKYY